MKTLLKAKKPREDKRPRIKIQLDHRTLVTVRSMAVFYNWKLNFPNAKIVS